MLVFADGVPNIDIRLAPNIECDELRLLNHNLDDMPQYVNEFKVALHLFDYCELQQRIIGLRGRNPFIDWQFLAARTCPIAIWNFRHAMGAANDFANRSAYVGPRLNRAFMGEAFAKFERDFPEFAVVRHSVAHAGEFAKTKEKYEENVFSGFFDAFGVRMPGGQRATIKNMLSDRTFLSTFSGKLVHCSITLETLNNLIEIQSLFFRAFRENRPAQAVPIDEGYAPIPASSIGAVISGRRRVTGTVR